MEETQKLYNNWSLGNIIDVDKLGKNFDFKFFDAKGKPQSMSN